MQPRAAPTGRPPPGRCEHHHDDLEHQHELLHTIENLLFLVNREELSTMADITALQAEVANVVASEAAAGASLDTLAQRIAELVAAAGTAVPQAAVDALTSALADARAALDTKSATDNPPPPPVV